MTEDQFQKLEKSIERFATAVSEDVGELRNEIAGLRADMDDFRTDVDGVRQEMRDGFTAVTGKVAGVHRRIDEELDKRRQLEVRMGRVEQKIAS